MMHKYLPHTREDIEEMLKVTGADTLDDLFSSIPKKLRLTKPYQIPSQLSDEKLTKHMQALASENKELTIFRGAGAYDHYTPSIVKALISRQEFLTSYTPYQPEVAQGTLQYIFEYQTMVCELTGMDVSNASMYDGSTATAEAMFMAYAQTDKTKILISDTVNPRTIDVLKTYAHYRHLEVVVIPNKDGVTNLHAVKEHIHDSMGLVVQNPNYYGIIEDLNGFSDVVHEAGGLFIMNSEGQALSLVKTQGEYDADIAVGDLQSLGLPLSFGGAYLGYLATKMKYVRKMPGRICGLTTDVDGKRAFVLTLQAREQHIRRAKANSNICSNQSLMALAVTVYLSAMGKEGLIKVANESMKGAHYLYQKLLQTNKFEVVYNQPFFKEFVLKAKFDVKAFETSCLNHSILGPLSIGDGKLLFAVTEKRTKEEMDKLVELVVNAK
ncbi:MAG: glycine dehydrogenase (aminomethyl-transferring) [Tenericutes bacterium GWC2_34_14]|nr:MAG: glycine dehydrogenase (aminomethyl-transferring) [Tenericutes bacterium GWA2_35_7]OHE28442.1 MAG: glycine dehydrogenase (aminomethyl-transferring) [Tenericutes bacterium GWC2_34_14]OHE33650.1 MAG: glycine dehydrogenase (aminomethyl-transferring) [Tenericutes bacterium GWE2_34_108]OHE36935.1 MAG: glycine dehydrogenase (aminomethyl-transferring) [Tenericutes bacterium GWF1_35_14]OHE37985.1 MAG: glycine dehydrogenase (aminomethyl-transferring) [Tenericutes bacterium GWF2_35_184]OHE42054.1